MSCSVHHHSGDKEVIAPQFALQTAGNQPQACSKLEHILALGRRCATLPELDARSTDAILGYDADGLPG